MIQGQGVYSKAEKTIIVAVINYYQVAEFLNIISKQKNTFAYYVDVMGVKGYFDWVKPEDDQTELQSSTQEE